MSSSISPLQLTDREADIMEILWSRGPSLVADVQAALDDKPRAMWAMTSPAAAIAISPP